MKWIALSLAFSLGACSPMFGDAGKKSNDADIAITAILDGAEFASKNGQFDLALHQLDPIVSETGEYHDLYAQLSPEVHFRVDLIYGSSALVLEKGPEAHRALVQASQAPFADEETWYLRFQSAKLVGDFADALVAINTLRKKWPHPVLRLGDSEVSNTEQGMGTLPNAEEAQLAFEDYLDVIDWEPLDPYFSKAVIRFHQAEHLYDMGGHDEAYAIASQIEDTDVLEVIGADKRFDAMVASDPPKFDAGKAAEKRVEIARSDVRKNPRRIEARTTLMSRLMEVGNAREALKEADAAIEVGQKTPAAERRRSRDFDNQLSRARTMKAFALFMLGSYDQAVRLEADQCHVCGININGVLIVSEMLVKLGHGPEALEFLAPLSRESLTFRERAEFVSSRSCAAVQTGNKTLVAEGLAFLKQHEAYAPWWRLHALLCANDLDGAADMVVAGLANPLERPLILQPLQRYKPDEAVPPFQKVIDARMERLRTRRDVLAALAPVGRINTYNVAYLGPLY